MPLKVVTEEVEKDVTLLEEADVEFVSLVRHGANRMPFRVIKEDVSKAGAEEKEGMPMKTNESSRHAVVQSIIFPKGVSVEKMAAQKGLAWLNEVTALEAEDHGGFSKYVMLDAKSIEDDSVSMMRIGNEGVWAIIGRPTTDVDLSSALSVGKMGETGELNVVQPITQAPIAEVALPPQRVLFEEVYYREYSNLGNAIMGILGQSCMEPEVRKEAIIAAVEAFKGFLMLALEMIESADGEFALKVEKVVELMVKDVEEKTKKSEGGLKSMFANKEEFVAAVTEIVAGLLDKASSKETEEEKKKRLEEDAKKSVEEEEKKRLEEEEKKRLAEEEAKKSGDIVSLTKKIEKLQAEVDDFGNQLKTQSSKDDGDPVKKTEKKSVFSGLLTRAGE